MKNRIIVTKTTQAAGENGKTVRKTVMKFYLKNDQGIFWMFTQPFSEKVYDWFQNGRLESEVLSFSKWRLNKRLSDTIERIPREIRYVQKYVMEEERTA